MKVPSANARAIRCSILSEHLVLQGDAYSIDLVDLPHLKVAPCPCAVHCPVLMSRASPACAMLCPVLTSVRNKLKFT